MKWVILAIAGYLAYRWWQSMPQTLQTPASGLDTSGNGIVMTSGPILSSPIVGSPGSSGVLTGSGTQLVSATPAIKPVTLPIYRPLLPTRRALYAST
jgi:hypothetical protein